MELFRLSKYPHYKPTEELHKELNTIRSGQHVKYNINYHIVWIPKYRKKLLANQRVKEVLTDILKGQSEQRGWKVLALEIMPDHLHLFLSVPPSIAVADVVNLLKGNTSRQLRLVFPFLKQVVRKSLWARGYYVSTAGFVSQMQVRKYIDAQARAMHKKPVKTIKREKQTKLGENYGNV
jgi:putative transposase